MDLLIDPRGTVSFIYDETLDLSSMGRLEIRRASSVEPDAHGDWWVDLAPVEGPWLGPFRWRSEALEGERRWLVATDLGYGA